MAELEELLADASGPRRPDTDPGGEGRFLRATGHHSSTRTRPPKIAAALAASGDVDDGPGR
ncbi:hypothetical protein ACWC5C_38665 [Streptomyces sp. NPDC001700]